MGAHYLRTSAMEGMYDYGMHVFERQDNSFVATHTIAPENAPAPYSIGSIRISIPDMLMKGNYKMFRRFVLTSTKHRKERTSMPMKFNMKQLFESEPYVLAPEIYDCISARCVEECGFKATVLSSAELANSYGLPDLGLLTQSDVVEATARICKFSNLPMIVDAEEGFGRALNAFRTAERLAEAGAAGRFDD